MNKLDSVLHKIDGYEDRIFFLPLKGKEIIELEVKMEVSFPDVFFDYLKYIGLLQDFIPTMLLMKDEYLFEKDFINRIVKKDPNSYFAFSKDGYGNLLSLKDKKYDDEYVYKILHETGVVKNTNYTFIDYVDKWVNKAIKEYNKRKNNIDKYWSVQFSFEAENDDVIIDVLKNKFDITINNDWKHEGTTPAGVKSYVITITFMGKTMELRKSEYNGWENYHYSFNHSESVTALLNDKSMIDNMNTIFESMNLGYKLINYGILES